MPEVSVIIPVFNTAAYMGKCLDSVLGQSFKDIEVIIVDDGSTDNSAEIAKEIAARDSRVRVLQTPHVGVGAVRNLGISESSGRFLMFVDSDDFLLPGAIESLYGLVSKGCSFAYGGFNSYDTDGRMIYGYEKYHRYMEGVGAELLPQYLINAFSPCMGTFMVEKDFIIKWTISFPEEYEYGEDRYFIANAILRCENVKSTKTAVYGYVKRPGSAVHTYTFARLHHVELLLRLLKELEDEGGYDNAIETLKSIVLPKTIVNLCYLLNARGMRWKKIRQYVTQKGYDKWVTPNLKVGVPMMLMLAIWRVSPMLHSLAHKATRVPSKVRRMLGLES